MKMCRFYVRKIPKAHTIRNTVLLNADFRAEAHQGLNAFFDFV